MKLFGIPISDEQIDKLRKELDKIDEAERRAWATTRNVWIK